MKLRHLSCFSLASYALMSSSCLSYTLKDLQQLPTSGGNNISNVVLYSRDQSTIYIRSLEYGGRFFYNPGGTTASSSSVSVRLEHISSTNTGKRWGTDFPCFPTEGPGDLDAAIRQHINAYVLNVPLPYMGVGQTWGNGLSINIKLCKSAYGWVSASYSGTPQTANIQCNLLGPTEITLTQAIPVIDAPYGLSCVGAGMTNVRLSVVGASMVYPTPGLSLWTQPPAKPILGVAGVSMPLVIRFGMDTPLPTVPAGKYQSTFVYVVEYL
ncbi:hypothetical protein G4234_00370 [Serratia marcescens]|uniref:hypothetical protein n=1 Tax=Serratia marcescens TaxID=615 RepID=UPI001419D62A|nr:hypothetical protein [Serratia marcescens]NIA32177.1 hypothetical protein [Serratia marcescens]